MIRLQSLDSSLLIPVLSGLLCDETTADSYIFINTLQKILPRDETIQDTYLIMSALDSLEDIFTNTKIIPEINKDILMGIIQDNIYEELKENKRAGFRQYANTQLQIELDVFNDETLGAISDHILDSIEGMFDDAMLLAYSLKQSSSALIEFSSQYRATLMRETGSVLEMMSNSDMMHVRMHYWGWSYFFSKFRINSSRDAGTFLTLLSDFVRTKDSWSIRRDEAITSLAQIAKLEERHIEDRVPLFTMPYEAFNECIKFVKHQNTVLVGGKGTGKTTFASVVAGVALANNQRVLFYSPESPGSTLFLSNVLLAYIRHKYGFSVNENQILGLEEPYEAGSDYSRAEKKILIQVAKEEIANSGNFKHIETYYQYKTMSEDMHADVKAFAPDILIFDHSYEVKGEAPRSEKVSKVANTLKDITKDYPVHSLLLSHPGSKFKDALPTQENPVSRDTTIAAWSSDIEALADNVIGAIKVGDNEVRMFFTKLRNGVIPPMYQIFRMIKPQGWFEYRPEDQLMQTDDTVSQFEAILASRGAAFFGEGIEEDDEFALEDE